MRVRAVPLLFLLDFCLLARLSNCANRFSISFKLRFIPSIIFAYAIAPITAMFVSASQ
jgi:hypothetical protein